MLTTIFTVLTKFPIIRNILVLLLVCGGVYFYGYHQGYDSRDDAAKIEAAKIEKAQSEAKDKLNTKTNDIIIKYVEKKTKIDDDTKSIKEEMRNVINENDKTCSISSDVARLYNRSLGNARTTSNPNGEANKPK